MSDKIRITVEKSDPNNSTGWRSLHVLTITEDFTAVMIDDAMEALANRINAAMGRL